MGSLPRALVISNLPILATAARSLLQDRYQIINRTWSGCAVAPVSAAELVIVDVTSTDPRSALGVVSRIQSEARVVICSMHENEVDVYDIGEGGFRHRGPLPSILEAVA